MTDTHASTAGKASKANGATPSMPPPPPGEGSDPFADLSKVAIDPEAMSELVEVKHYAVRPPKKDEWFRVHRDGAYRLPVLIYKHDEGMDTTNYLVLPSAGSIRELQEVARPHVLQVCINGHGEVFIWPRALPMGGAGGGRTWAITRARCAEDATDEWIRMVANRHTGGYETIRSSKPATDEPQWPDVPFNQMLRVGFPEGAVIADDSHPIVQGLRNKT